MSAKLVRSSITPNQISVASIGFSAIGGLALVFVVPWLGLIVCILCIQARLLCNLLDGMVAIEGGKKSALGTIYNEFPDRIADSFLLVALGYATPYPFLGWFCALAAALTAYVRVFGGSLGLAQSFKGPMAKQHRMAIMTIGCVLSLIENFTSSTNYALPCAALIIAVGSLATCVTRTVAIAQLLRAQA
ncbi:MAG: CDP-alcohol phosphatidyltransferase family protein [Pseudomonadota bacterium]